jgi:hypothetical protein
MLRPVICFKDYLHKEEVNREKITAIDLSFGYGWHFELGTNPTR